GRVDGAGPGGKAPAQVDQGVADGGQLPVDDGCQFGTVVAVHHIGQVIVAVNNAGGKAGGEVGFQPLGDIFHAGEVPAAIPVGVAGVTLQLGGPPGHLAGQIVVRLAKVFQGQPQIIHLAEAGDALHQGQAHAVAHLGGRGVVRGQPGGGVEAPNLFHQVKGV